MDQTNRPWHQHCSSGGIRRRRGAATAVHQRAHWRPERRVLPHGRGPVPDLLQGHNLLQAGRGELALTLADSLSDAWNGNAEAGFNQKLDKLRGLSATYNNYIQIVASEDSGIKTLADLKGKRLSVGAARSGTELNARAVLKAAGLAYSDLAKVEYLPFGESVELMKNRQLDATLQSAGLGVDLSTAVKIVVVPVPADVVAKIGDAAYQPAVIPANTYGGQTADVATVAIPNFLVTHSGVSDDVAYRMAKAMYDNIDTLYAAHNAAK
nr:TAXI family TRAP transporter solute-binding subunit [Hydrogenophaga sp.]